MAASDASHPRRSHAEWTISLNGLVIEAIDGTSASAVSFWAIGDGRAGARRVGPVEPSKSAISQIWNGAVTGRNTNRTSQMAESLASAVLTSECTPFAGFKIRTRR